MFESFKYNDYYVVKIKGREATLKNAEKFKEYVTSIIKEGDHFLVISFEGVKYIDSTFMGALVSLLKYALFVKGDIAVANLNKDIYNLFCLVRMEKVIMIYDKLPDSFTGSFGRYSE